MASADLSSNATAMQGAVVAAATSDATLTLDVNRIYTLTHLGLAVDGSTAATTSIWFKNGGEPTATFAEDTNKWILRDGKSIQVGPGVTALHFKTASGAPTFQVEPSLPLFGQL